MIPDEVPYEAEAVVIYDDGIDHYPPPVYEEPENPYDPGSGTVDTGNPEIFGLAYTGQVINNENGNPLPNATVRLYKDGNLIASKAANASGEFYFDVPTTATQIEVTYIDFVRRLISAAPYNNSNYNLVPMLVDENELPEVIVTDGMGKWDWIVYAALGAKYLHDKNKGRRVGEVKAAHIGIGIALILGFDTIKKIFEGIGFWDSADTKDLDSETVNPLSPWNPAFLNSAPSNASVLSAEMADGMLFLIYESFGAFNDDETKVIGIFKTLKTKSQLASLAYYYNKETGGDLLTWLRGGSWPYDRLSDQDVATINAYIKNLPNYIA